MRSGLLQSAVVFLILGSASCLYGDPPAAQDVDSAAYLSFFREAMTRTTASQTVTKDEPLTLNGQPTGRIQPELIQPSIQDALGITVREGQSIIDASVACSGEIDSLDADARALVFESRLRAANDEKPSDALAERLRQLEAARTQVILNYVAQLRTSLGTARFQLIDDYVRAHAASGSFFPTIPARKL